MPSLNAIAVATGAFLVGLGTFLSGWAAWRAMKKRNGGKDESVGR